jgi:hypothetical protein
MGELIPRYGYPWDGNVKIYTKDCSHCNYHKNIKSRDVCGWGVSFKYLQASGNPRRCQVISKPVPKYNSLAYLIQEERRLK